MPRTIPRRARPGSAAALFALSLGACSSPNPDHSLQPFDPSGDSLDARLEPLARAIGDRRIVLIGENGHGVAQHTELKVRLVEWLHRELGFDVVAFESGFFECDRVRRRLDSLSARDALYDCLRYPFQHAEILPLFERMRATRDDSRPLVLAGIDPQEQGFDSEHRPADLAARLAGRAPELAARMAAIDTALFLVESQGGQDDSVYRWVLEHGDEARVVYDSAAGIFEGADRWSVRLALGLLDRLEARARAEAGGRGTPVRYYELRDEWMARAVDALADSIAGPRKVVVWLHNDHARYGEFGGGIRSTGGYLKEWRPEDVFSIGLFMGRGTVADNGRTEREVGAPPAGGIEDLLRTEGHAASYLILRGTTIDSIRIWADSARPYLRIGLEPLEMVPAREFDALFYVDRVTPPDYRIPER